MTENIHDNELHSVEAHFLRLMLGHCGLYTIEQWKREEVDHFVRRIFLLAYDPVRAKELGITDAGDMRIEKLELFPSEAQPNPELLAEREAELKAAQEFIFNNFKPRVMRRRVVPGGKLPSWFARFVRTVR